VLAGALVGRVEDRVVEEALAHGAFPESSRTGAMAVGGLRSVKLRSPVLPHATYNNSQHFGINLIITHNKVYMMRPKLSESFMVIRKRTNRREVKRCRVGHVKIGLKRFWLRS
jgi:hypothetical protein